VSSIFRHWRINRQYGDAGLWRKALLLPIWIAKAVAILANFITNFSLSYFVVFRVCANMAQRSQCSESINWLIRAAS
jgi:putative flippase GtrA